MPADPTYALEIDLGEKPAWIDGFNSSQEDKALGSSVNREDRKEKIFKNCLFLQHGKKMFIEITKSVKAGSERFTTYSHGYRFNDFNVVDNVILATPDERNGHNFNQMQANNASMSPISPLHQYPVPPAAFFDTPEEAQTSINNFARNRGYAVIRLQTVKDKRLKIRLGDRREIHKAGKSTP
ncbi:hypothetical protein AC1031_016907 [Aphanomyces cochlioides]|nr:hypothetical protein AC1031_016907 [Aphanomyces cochlioides]